MAFGSLHNAAVLEPIIPLTEISLQDWRTHHQTNLEGPLFLTQSLLEKLKTGRILHISSGAAHNAYAGWGAYCASKAGLHMIYKVLNKELTDRKIVVGSVRPGVVNTPMQNQVRKATKEVFPEIKKFVDLKEQNQLLDAGIVAKFLCHVLFETDDNAFAENEWDIREHTINI